MNYKLYKETVPEYSALQQVLYNRGIPIEEQKKWLNAGWDDIHDWRLFGQNIEDALNFITNAVSKKKKMLILWDSDPDGAFSGAIINNFLYAYFPEYAEICVENIFHTGKQHGLGEFDLDKIAAKCDVIWIPDASSSDYKELEYLYNKGKEILITDHHLADKVSPHAIVINNQLCDYPDKNLSGAGVTWQVCRAWEEKYKDKNTPIAKNLLDLCAVGNISDMMNSQELEVKAIVNLGLSNLKNKFLREIAEKHSYSIAKMNGLNYYSCAFYITPYLNCIFRSGTKDEKELVFNSLLDKNNNQEVRSSKRGEKEKYIPLYEEAVTITERVKRRQTKEQDEMVELFEQKIKEQNLLNNAILTFICIPDEIPQNLAGLIANKEQAKYQRPCLVLTEHQNETGKIVYEGSGRNYSLSEKENLMKELLATGCVNWVRGHENAHGVSIDEDKFEEFLKKFNEQYKDVDQTPTYWVDYIWNSRTLDDSKILDIADLNIYGQEIPESLVAVKDIPLNSNIVTLMGLEKGHPTLKIDLGNGVSAIKFKSSEEEWEKFCDDSKTLTIVAKPNKNEWNGNISAQLIVEDYELTEQEEWIF